MPHEMLQDYFVVIDYTKGMEILAIINEQNGAEEIIGVGQYGINEGTLTAEIALVIRDDYQNMGIGTELLSYLTYLAKRNGLLGFTAEVLPENKPALKLLEKMGFETKKRFSAGVYLYDIAF